MVEIIESTTFYSGNRNYRVINSGFYDECELVEVCYDEDDSNLVVGAVQAHYIVYGYHFGDQPESGGEEAIPPESVIDPNAGG
jgi:hypothetical protein